MPRFLEIIKRCTSGAWSNAAWAAAIAAALTHWGRLDSLWGRPFAAVVFACTFGVMFSVTTAVHYWLQRCPPAAATSDAGRELSGVTELVADYARHADRLRELRRLDGGPQPASRNESAEPGTVVAGPDGIQREMDRIFGRIVEAFDRASKNDMLAALTFSAIEAVVSRTAVEDRAGAASGRDPMIADIQMLIKQYRIERILS